MLRATGEVMTTVPLLTVVVAVVALEVHEYWHRETPKLEFRVDSFGPADR